MNELSAKQTSGKDLTLDIGLNVISAVPIWGIAANVLAGGKRIKTYKNDQVRWLTFLDKIKDTAE